MTVSTRRLSRDFWIFWSGQVVSNLGSSFTMFAMPLLIFKLTHSAVNLALTMAAAMLPYVFFGLIIGAWVDRLDRKKVMICADLGMVLVVGSVPFMSAAGHLTVWWIYGAAFLNQTLNIFFNAGEFAAIPSLVGKDDLVTANGRIQASYVATTIAGPLLAGGLAALVALPSLLLIDAVSYVASAGALFMVRTSFNAGPREARASTIREDVVEGLRYVLGHPVLRNISAMMAMVNFVSTTIQAQIVLYAKDRLSASNAEIGVLFAAEGAAVVIFSLLAGRLRRRWSFSVVALGCLTLSGALTVIFALIPSFWPAVPVFALASGTAGLFNINTGSLRQAIVPDHLLGRVMSIAGVLAWSAIPLGALLGGFVITWTGNVALVFAGIGALTMAIPLGFAFTPLGHADRYLPATPVPEAAEPAELPT